MAAINSFQVDLDKPCYYLWYCYEKTPPLPHPPAPLVKGQREQYPHHVSILLHPCAYYSTHTLFARCYRLQCVTVININYQRSPNTEQFITAKIAGNALKQGSRTHSVLHPRSSQLQKYKAARMSRRTAVEQRRYTAGMADIQGWQLETCKSHKNWACA